jgi:hypothetical protein
MLSIHRATGRPGISHEMDIPPSAKIGYIERTFRAFRHRDFRLMWLGALRFHNWHIRSAICTELARV